MNVGSAAGSKTRAREGRPRPSLGVRDRVLLVATLILIPTVLYLTFLWVPAERVQGQVYRIFFFHVPVSWVAYLAFLLTFIASVAYLRNGRAHWDRLAASAAELGVAFTTLSLITGAIWGKPIFGAWWAWDARLTTTLMMWLIYVGYLLVRAYATEPGQGARLAAAVGTAAFAVVPINYLSIRIWEGLHPGPNIGTDSGLDMTAGMGVTLLLALVAMTALFVTLLVARYRLRTLVDEVAELRQLVEEGNERG